MVALTRSRSSPHKYEQFKQKTSVRHLTVQKYFVNLKKWLKDLPYTFWGIFRTPFSLPFLVFPTCYVAFGELTNQIMLWDPVGNHGVVAQSSRLLLAQILPYDTLGESG